MFEKKYKSTYEEVVREERDKVAKTRYWDCNSYNDCCWRQRKAVNQSIVACQFLPKEFRKRFEKEMKNTDWDR